VKDWRQFGFYQKENAQEIFNGVDTSGQGFIDHAEFEAAVLRDVPGG
jgi:Ca2+-binding EF-hand superfamily protein